MATSRLTPCCSATVPKVRRATPSISSSPMIISISPSRPATTPRAMELFGQAADGGKPEQHQRENLHRAELDRDGRHLLQQQHHDRQADQAAKERGDDGSAQRNAGLTLQRHRITVEDGGGGRWGSGNADQDGRDRTAGHAPDIHAEQQRDRTRWLHAEGEGQHQRQCHRVGESRDGSEDQTHHRAGKRGEDRVVGEREGEGLVQGVHSGTPRHNSHRQDPCGMGAPSTGQRRASRRR